MLRHVPYSGTRLVAYEQLRGLFGNGDAVGLGTKMALGATAGALGQLVAVPADVAKVTLQAAGPGGGGMAAVLRGIHAQHGLPGLWRGTVPAVQRAALVNLGELATYDGAKGWAAANCPPLLLEMSGVTDAAQAPPVHVFAALASGLAACAASTPADVVKTRLMAQALATGPPAPGAPPPYAGALDCLRRSVAAEGYGVLYRGFWPTFGRLGPWQLTFWVVYEKLRAASGLGAF